METAAGVPSQRDLRSRLFDAILTTEPTRRAVLRMWATSFATYVLYSGIGISAAGFGLADADAVTVLVTAMLVVNGIFYVLFRLGVARRSSLDRDLGVTQLVVGIVFMWFSYAIVGPAAPATLIIMATHVVYAMFTMTPKRVRALVVFSLAGVAATMTVSWRIDAGRYPIRVQLVSLAFASIALPLIGRLAGQVTSMSDRLRAQRRDLSAALEQVRLMASSDELTKTHNRRHMVELMRGERERIGGAGTVCVALLDIDMFKSVNDRFGHAVGDEVLRRFAAEAKTVLRQTDLFARWGGEEFMTMFVDTDLDDAAEILDRLRDQVATIDFDFDFGVSDLAITFSAGLVEVLAGEMLEHAIERADQEMYRAKSSGRNRVCRAVTREPSRSMISAASATSRTA